MKKLSAEQIQQNWNTLIDVINTHIGDDRRDNLLKFYDDFQDRMMFAPASAKGHYHNAMPGGYVEHILHIVSHSLELKQLWEKNGAEINFTDEELVFAALHHDLGKVGDMDKDYYVPQESEWHRKNRGEIFTHNGELQYMTVTDRAIYLLNQFQVPMTENEYVGLRLTDGLYEEANKSYYISYNPDWALKSNIAYVLHQADLMATKIEYDEWKRGDTEEREAEKAKVASLKKSLEMPNPKPKKAEPSPELSQKSQDLFQELFGDK